MSLDSLVRDSEAMLDRLVAFDTTSSRSNRAMIDDMATMLAPLGARMRTFPSPDGTKANLLASIGPDTAGGVILSGHTDVVPIEGQTWSTAPFRLTRVGDRLHGRGTADMKGFIACAMAAAPLFAARGLARPIHFAWSYDEEVGCRGAPAMIEGITHQLPAPAAAIIGEPTDMKIVGGHKGICLHHVSVRGHEAHSSLTHLGLSANMVAARLMAKLVEIEERLVQAADPESPFEPRHSTLTIGTIHGGTAVNILAGECRFAFDLRYTPDVVVAQALAPFFDLVAELDAEMRRRFPYSGIIVDATAQVPPLAPERDGAAAALVRGLTGDNGGLRVVPYGSEAGQFQETGLSAVICGPGSIEQAHQPDEFIERSQIAACAGFMARLADAMT